MFGGIFAQEYTFSELKQIRERWRIWGARIVKYREWPLNYWILRVKYFDKEGIQNGFRGKCTMAK